MNISPIIFFSAMSGALHLEKNCKFSSPRRISLTLELGDDQDVTTQNKHSLRDASWTIEFIEIKNFDQPIDLEESIGQLSYLPQIRSDFADSQEACHALVYLDEENFSFLLSYMQSGRLPDSISIQVDKLKYGGILMEKLKFGMSIQIHMYKYLK